jgi:hypothetical protein
MRAITALFALVLLSVSANAQQITFGHLETKDDVGINWLYFHCNQTGQGLDCDVFQTLIMHELARADRDAEVKKMLEGNAVEDFKKGTGGTAETCKAIDESAANIDQMIKTGKGPNGVDVDPREIREYFTAMSDVCKNPTLDNLKRMAEMLADSRVNTCTIHNDYSRIHFKWNPQTQSWVSQEGPIGPCGTINIGTLEPDPSVKGFYNYTEKRIYTNPNGVTSMPGKNLSCKELPEHTLSYTWHAQDNLSQCVHIMSQ